MSSDKVDEEYKTAQMDGFMRQSSIDKTLKIEFPFDLNNLFNMSYSFDVLKQAIEYLAKQSVTMQDDIDALKNVKPKTPTSAGAAEPEVTLQMFNELNVFVNGRLEDDNKRISDLEDQVKLLGQMGAPSDGNQGAGLLDTLKDLIEKLRIELNNKINSDVGDLKSEVDKNA